MLLFHGIQRAQPRRVIIQTGGAGGIIAGISLVVDKRLTTGRMRNEGLKADIAHIVAIRCFLTAMPANVVFADVLMDREAIVILEGFSSDGHG